MAKIPTRDTANFSPRAQKQIAEQGVGKPAPAESKPTAPKEEAAPKESLLKRFGEGFLEGSLGGTISAFKEFTPGAGKGPEDAKESGKTTPSTGDTGKDTVNAIRDLQSDLNSQTAVMKQVEAGISSQNQVMSNGFNGMIRILNALRMDIGKISLGSGGKNDLLGDALGSLGDLFGGGKGEAKAGAKAAGKGVLGTLGGLAKGAGRLLGKAGPLAALGMGAYDAYEGWGEAGQNFDLKEGEEATTGQKLSSSLGSVASGLSFGLLDKKSVAQGIHGAGDWVSNLFSGNSIDERRAKNIPKKDSEKDAEKMSDEFDPDTGKRLSQKEIEQRSKGAPVYTAMGDFTGTYEAPPEAKPLDQRQAGRNNLSDKSQALELKSQIKSATSGAGFRSGAMDQVPEVAPVNPGFRSSAKDQVLEVAPVNPGFRSGAKDQVSDAVPVNPGFRSSAKDQVPEVAPVKSESRNDTMNQVPAVAPVRPGFRSGAMDQVADAAPVKTGPVPISEYNGDVGAAKTKLWQMMGNKGEAPGLHTMDAAGNKNASKASQEDWNRADKEDEDDERRARGELFINGKWTTKEEQQKLKGGAPVTPNPVATGAAIGMSEPDAAPVKTGPVPISEYNGDVGAAKTKLWQAMGNKGEAPGLHTTDSAPAKSAAADQVPEVAPVRPGFRSGAMDQVADAAPAKSAAMSELAQKEQQKKAEVAKDKDKDSMLYSAKELTFKAENVKFEVTGNFIVEATGGMQVVSKAGAAQAAPPPPAGSTSPGAEPPPAAAAGGGATPSAVTPGVTAPSGGPAAPAAPPAAMGGGGGMGGAGTGVKGAGPSGAPAPGGAQPTIPAGGFGEATKGTGPSGMLPESSLKPIGQGGHRAIPAAADAFVAMKQAAAADGVNLTVTDSYRSYAAQVDVKRRKPNLAATPGKSNHGWGLAFDMGFGSNVNSREYKWMQENAGKFGFSGPLPNPKEPWHWTYTGGKADPTAGPVAGKGEGGSKQEKGATVAGEPPPQGVNGGAAAGGGPGGGQGGAPAGAGPAAGGASDRAASRDARKEERAMGAPAGTGVGGRLSPEASSTLSNALGSPAGSGFKSGGADQMMVDNPPKSASDRVAGMAAERDANAQVPPSGASSPSITQTFNSPDSKPTTPSNKVESAMPPANVFADLFGIGLGGKGSHSFAG
jgi:zinc D-Ala-D-Ala carboxypeptidase